MKRPIEIPIGENQELQKMKRDAAQKQIDELHAKLYIKPTGQNLKIYRRTLDTLHLADAYKTIGDVPMMLIECRKAIRFCKENWSQIETLDPGRADNVFKNFYKAHILMAPHSFHHYLVAIEWNYPDEMKFYTNRYVVMAEWVRELQALEDNRLDILGLSAPPRTGKTGIGSLFVSWVIGRHPDKSCFFASHTNQMAEKFIDDVYRLITDERRCWEKVFPGLQIDKSVEGKYIDLSPKSWPNNYKTLYARGIDGNMAGILEASHLIYCDDLIKDIEEALNPTRVATANLKYSTDIKQRRTNSNVNELHIATRWSVHDVVSTIEMDNEDNPRAKFIRKPGLDENGESNFMFPHNPMTREHFEGLKRSMDDVSFECIVQQNPIERDGLVFPRDSLNYYEGVLPDGEPDFIRFAADIAFGGADFLSMPVAAGYGWDAYIIDVVHLSATKETTRPMVIDAIIQNGCTRGFFEANNGGQEYAEWIAAELKKRGYRCAIESKKAPTNKSKLDRILEAQSEIKGLYQDEEGYRLHFLSKTAREHARSPKMYEQYITHLCNFNQSAKYIGKQKDDAADSTASLVKNMLGVGHATKVKVFARPF